ncbi:hypothetical protein OROMI_032133 [Orobanche minor]
MYTDRNWMLMGKRKRKSAEYENGVQHFLNSAYSNEDFVEDGNIKCPCCECKNRFFKSRGTVELHLKKYGFVRGYDRWTNHGEGVEFQSTDVSSSEFVNQVHTGMEDMVRDVVGPDFNWGAQFEDHTPNRDAQGFYDLLKSAEEPLFDGCKTHTKLSAMCELFNIKSDYNLPEACYDRLTTMMKNLIPEGDLLPNNFYKTKRELAKLGLEYKRIHACKNHCMLYYKENEHLQECNVCQQPRYKPRKKRSRKKVPYKVLHYLPLTPRLKRLYMSPHTAEQMIWHTKKPESGAMGHPAHSEAWRHFNTTHQAFAEEPRNVRIALCTDGFTLFNNFNSGYSCWPVIVAVYNLPPGMAMQDPYLFLSLVIPGPDGPGKSLDVYLRPLMDELKMLWNDGVTAYDVSRKENFQMRAALLWTVSDFPAYGMLSGWSTHGIRACPYCMEYTKSFWLKHGGAI